MKTILSSETTDIPDGVKIKVHTKIIEIEGSCRNLICNFKLLLQIMELSNIYGIEPRFPFIAYEAFTCEIDVILKTANEVTVLFLRTKSSS
ncbi:hypothetical protein ACFX1T_007352 [Malus domestica]